MKKLLFLCILIAAALLSCEKLELPCGKTEEPVPQIPTPLEIALTMIKENSRELEKYFIFDPTGELQVLADIMVRCEKTGAAEQFRVFYDLKNMEAESSGNHTIRFTVKSPEAEELHAGILLWKPEYDGSGLLLSFDDRHFYTWERHFDLFDTHNAHVTFFVYGSLNPFSGEALRRGHDVGYHSLTHPVLPGLSRQAFARETVSQVEQYRKAGIPLASFAYPFGLYEAWMHEELLNTFSIVRGFNINFQIYTGSEIQNSFILSKGIDNIFFEDDDEFKAAIAIMLRTVKFLERDFILPLTTHAICGHAGWGITPRRLEYLLQTARDLRLRFFRFSDFATEQSERLYLAHPPCPCYN